MDYKQRLEANQKKRQDLVGCNINGSIIIEYVKQLNKRGYYTHCFKYQCAECKQTPTTVKSDKEIFFKKDHNIPILCRKCAGKNFYIFNIQEGDIIDGLKIIKIYKDYSNKYKSKREIVVDCICKCGRTSTVLLRSIKRGSTSCATCSNRKYIGDLSADFYLQLKIKANRRNLEFKLTQEYLWQLYLSQNGKCALSGVDIKFATTRKDYHQHKQSVSLDRKDSSQPYIENNVQWVHKDINMMKQRYSDKYYIDFCHKVSEFQKQKEQNLCYTE